MKKIISILALLLLMPASSMAAGGSVPLDHVDIDLSNKASLQRGFKYVVNYCLSCHNAAYSRFSRVGEDLGIDQKLLENEMIFTRDEMDKRNKQGALMKVAIPARYAKASFGTVPPDLSLLTRSRGPDWIYTYLRSFYVDESRPFGVNNVVFPNVGMPHVLWELQGWQGYADPHAHHEEAKEAESSAHGEAQPADAEAPVHESGLYLIKPGKLTPYEYDAVVTDIVNFMEYLSEPSQMKRKTVGIWVMLFLVVLFVLAYLLKKEYWKDIH
ncbi:MAG: cytochrome c1 [Thiotrichales bacterium]